MVDPLTGDECEGEEMAGVWGADPFGRYELRYYDGQAWTEHVSNAGITSTDPPVGSAAPSGSPQVGAAALTSIETHNLSDSNVLWSGERQSTTSMATGGRMATARYQLTRDAILFEQGTLSTRSEMVPLWGVMDADVTVSMTQKARGVGDVRVWLDQATAARFGQNRVFLQSVHDPQRVRTLILQQVAVVRRQQLELQHAREVELRHAGAASSTVTVSGAPPAAASGPSVIEQLKDLAALRDAGVLTEAEFAAQKARILG